ncbi:hypothetical protein [Actinomadura rayongensis]|uniref:Uncharacterized protein n=1 Tax=Actinomadura rayongensis TaxID=1429076 RepID=A0A6I4W765_9ACTN|nr:hypothetical protein [Actinomadura rayongensis]MXQ64580.1 hypothetical protein [Actinomadura rayongensis]
MATQRSTAAANGHHARGSRHTIALLRSLITALAGSLSGDPTNLSRKSVLFPVLYEKTFWDDLRARCTSGDEVRQKFGDASRIMPRHIVVDDDDRPIIWLSCGESATLRIICRQSPSRFAQKAHQVIAVTGWIGSPGMACRKPCTDEQQWILIGKFLVIARKVGTQDAGHLLPVDSRWRRDRRSDEFPKQYRERHIRYPARFYRLRVRTLMRLSGWIAAAASMPGGAEGLVPVAFDGKTMRCAPFCACTASEAGAVIRGVSERH